MPLAHLVGCNSVIDREGTGGGATSGNPTSVASTASSGSEASSSTGVQLPPGSTRKVDVVFAVDNSADAHESLPFTIDAATTLLQRLANPECVDGAGNVQVVASHDDACPPGFARAFAPAADMHVGIITSSLGGLGGGVCGVGGATTASNPTNDDRGHLVWRTGEPPANSGNTAGTTYQELGFFAWDAAATASPPGITSIATLTDRVSGALRGVGNVGCGLEMPLESAYRFLVDPAPYDDLVPIDGGDFPSKQKSGVDGALLAQRSAFLRPDSIVVVVMIGSANDCSIVVDGQAWGIARPEEPWFRGSSTCAVNPADACCYSCGLGPPNGCADDPICQTPRLATNEDPINLRCNLQKQRYGVSLLYPVERYVNAFTAPTLTIDAPDLETGSMPVPNPLLASRSPQDVFFVTLGGVPWQATVDDPVTPVPQLLDAQQRAAAMFPTRYVGNTDAGVPPTEPIMVESIDPRPGVATGNPFNGNDYAVPDRDDLQLACIFPLATPIPDGNPCFTHPDRPTCSGTTQTHGSAYPTARQLRLAEGLGNQGIVGSMCPPEAIDAASPAYGYRVAVNGLARQLYGR